MSFPANPRRKLPLVYDAAYYGYDLHVPLVDPRLTAVQTFTMSASATAFQTTAEDFIPSGTTSVNYTPLLHSLDPVLTNLDTGLIAHEGNTTAFNQDYLIEADMSAVVHQLQISAAFALNVSTWVDGTLLLDGLRVSIASYQSNAKPIMPPYVTIIRPETAFTALSANGTHLFIVRAYVDVPFKIAIHGPVVINLQILTAGAAGTDTYQIGIVDMYPVHKTTAAKRLFPSEIIAHIHPIPEHTEELDKETGYTLLGIGNNK